MRELTREKIARYTSRRLPGLLANYHKACAVALIHELVKDGVLREPPRPPRKPRKAAKR